MWQPTASQQNLKQRADFLRQIREFFYHREVLEVDTPLLSSAGGTDVNIDLMRTDEDYFLASSPEFPLKRLLCAGAGDIYSLGHVFRKGEAGSKHNPEFTMLEWYRVGWSFHHLMEEVEELCSNLLAMPPARRVTYQALFEQYLDVDPFSADTQVLASMGAQASGLDMDALTRDGWLDLLFSYRIEPQLTEPTFIYNFPVSQAALSKTVNEGGLNVAQRFELVWQGVELANGYQELTDADEQRRRFEADDLYRKTNGAERVPIDMNLVAAMHAGMPECSGVAMGVDRLLMQKLKTKNIADAIAFPIDRA